MNVNTWLSRMIAETGFLETYGDFVPILARLDAVDDGRSPLMGVSLADGRIRLHVNVAVFEADPSGFRGVLQHELHHVILGHVDDPAYGEAEYPMIMMVAKEISANESITEPLPGSPIVWKDYVKYGIVPGQSTLERYELLVEALENGDYDPPLATRCCLGEGEGQPDGLLDGMPPETVRKLMRAGSMRQMARLMAVAAPPAPETRDWRLELRRFAASRPERRPSMRRPNRRDPNGARRGELPGWTRRPERLLLVIVIDTSSSMDDELFPRIAGELKAMAGVADLIIIECDDKVRRQYPYEGGLRSVVGRGGTDLRPPFAPGILARHRPDGVVYITDGEGRYPETDPDVPTLWLLTGHRPFDCGWGYKVRMFVPPPGTGPGSSSDPGW